jgi:hypothetical protein
MKNSVESRRRFLKATGLTASPVKVAPTWIISARCDKGDS